jgi:hypothetical protein
MVDQYRSNVSPTINILNCSFIQSFAAGVLPVAAQIANNALLVDNGQFVTRHAFWLSFCAEFADAGNLNVVAL